MPHLVIQINSILASHKLFCVTFGWESFLSVRRFSNIGHLSMPGSDMLRFGVMKEKVH